MNRYSRTAEHFRIEKVKTKASCRFYVFDISAKAEVRDLSSYARKFETHSPLTVEKNLYHVIRIYEYCRLRGLPLHAITDDVLKDYRNWELRQTKADKSYRGHESTAKFTVNTKLDSILNWLNWMQSSQRMSFPGVTFPQSEKGRGGRVVNRRPRSGVYFEGTAAKSAKNVTVVPSSHKRAQIEEIIISAPVSTFCARRNLLGAKLVSMVGLRVESLNSLLVSQFQENERCTDEGDSIVVIPVAQKFDRRHEYSVPMELVFEVRRFIEEFRNPLVKVKNGGKDLSLGRLFVSQTTAQPMTARAFSHIYGSAMREAGLEKGNAIHFLRKVFGTDAVEADIAQRMQYGMDVRTETVSAGAALKLKHASPDTTRPYVLRAGGEVMARIARADEAESKQLRTKLLEEREVRRKLEIQLAAATSALQQKEAE